jgi:hypothetical protein
MSVMKRLYTARQLGEPDRADGRKRSGSLWDYVRHRDLMRLADELREAAPAEARPEPAVGPAVQRMLF